MTDYCKNCGAKLEAEDDFCPDCGSKAESRTIICKSCGEKIDCDSRFCKNCGQTTREEVNFCPECGNEIAKGEEFCSECGAGIYQKRPEGFMERNRKAIVAALLVAVVIVGVSALVLTSVPQEIEPQNVEVGSTNFIIPGDYSIDPSTIDVDYKYASAIFAKGWVSDDGKIIYIATMTVPYNVDADNVLSSEGGSHRTMMGHEGYYTEKEGLYNFAFKSGGYICVVTVSDPRTFDDINCLG